MKSKNILILSLAFVWLWSGIQPIIFKTQFSLNLLQQVGIHSTQIQWLLLIASSVLDCAFGVLCVTKMRFQAAFWLIQWVTVLIYSLILAFRLPEMWMHPFAPLIKNVPILAILYFLFQQNYQEKSS